MEEIGDDQRPMPVTPPHSVPVLAVFVGGLVYDFTYQWYLSMVASLLVMMR